jgi:hypothetical protein
VRNLHDYGQSALGQKQTFALQNVMSALLPKADIRTEAARVELEYFVTPPSDKTWGLVAFRAIPKAD